MKHLLFIFLLVTTAMANPYWELAQQKKLYDQSYWNLLLHNVNGESEIDDASFFHAKDGKYNAKSEMKATLEALLNETRLDDNASGCRFPARKRYLKDQLSIPEERFPKVVCSEYEKVKARLQPYSASLVFPAGHKNSPASMFGHSFIRIDSQKKSKLLSYAVNYAAFTDEKNGFVYAVGGLTGFYQGRYSLLPYYEKIKEYVNAEQRDIWEYDLNLTPDETMRMFEHIWESNRVFSYYYFFTENCSYNLLWFLEVARPGVKLRDYFFHQVIPVETIFAVEDEGLIAQKHFRASRYRKLQALSKHLSSDEIALAIKVMEGKVDPRSIDIQDIQQKRYILETAVEYLQYRNSQATLAPGTNYRKRFLSILSALSALGKGEKTEVPIPVNPLKGHRSVRVSLGLGTRNDHGFQMFSFRPSFHDLDDNDDGYIRGTHIEFFNTDVTFFNDEVKVEKMNMLAIESYSPRNQFFDPTAWRIKVGWDRDFNDTAIRPSVAGGAGFSWGNEHGFVYVMADVRSYYKDRLDLGASGSFGGVWQQHDKAKMVFETSYTYFDKDFGQRINRISQNFTLGQNHALSFSFKEVQKAFVDDEQLLVHYRYYY